MMSVTVKQWLSYKTRTLQQKSIRVYFMKRAIFASLSREMATWLRFAIHARKTHMHIFHFELIDFDLWNAFCEVSPCGSFLFSRKRQKKVCTPGDEAVMKIHKKLFSGIPINFTIFGISPKLQRIWSWNFGFEIRKIWAFIWYQKIYYFRLSPGEWECDRHKGL